MADELLDNVDMYDVKNLSKEELLSEEKIKYIFAIENPVQKQKVLNQFEDRAKELNVKRNFTNLMKAYQAEMVIQQKSSNSKKTNFTNCPYPSMKTGEWEANDVEIFKYKYDTTMTPIKVKACSHPIIPIERLINLDTNLEKIKLAFYKDQKWQTVIVEKTTIASKSKILQLANFGIEVNENNAKELITYLADVLELNDIKPKVSTNHLGWIDKDFVPYTDKYVLDVDKEFKQKIDSISESGNYEEWKKYIRNLRKDSKTLRFIIAASFAGVLVRIFKLNTFIVHLWGRSGNGKTVAEMVCASIWGRPDNDMISNLSNTAIANERLCNFYRNMPIFLDELQIAKARYKSFDEVIYTLTEGKGKERGTVDNGIREQTSWQTIIILNGEEPITSDTSKEGVKNRVIEINDDTPIIEDGNATVKFIQDNYGFAGKEFIDLIADRKQLEQVNNKFVKDISELTEYKKQVNAFACIMTADYYCSKLIFNDEPLSLDDIREYIREDTDEADRYYNYLIDQLNINKNKLLKREDNSTQWDIPTGEIWGKIEQTSEYSNNRKIIGYYIYPEIVRRIFAETSTNWNSIKKKLADRGYIETSKEEQSSTKKVRYTIKERMPEGRRNMVKVNIK
jgi:putative DNA primase/helicase|nr:MAG TPA: active helicase ring shaped helicase [Caudoviricetes sp.]